MDTPLSARPRPGDAGSRTADASGRRPLGGHRRPSGPRPATATTGFRPDIQGLRALAVGLVVVYHLFPNLLTGGYVGVDVFFVISGYLITGHLWRTVERTGRVGFLDFYGRRARRLVPGAVIVLVVTWIASRLILPVTRLPDTGQQIIASALYVQNWVLANNAVDYGKSDDAASPVQHFWSLSVEEQFYIVWPVLLLVAAAVGLAVRRRRRAAAGSDARANVAARNTGLVLALLVVVVSLTWSVIDTRRDPAAAYFVTTTRMWELGFGAVAALLAPRVSQRIGRVGLLAWVGLGMIFFSAITYANTTGFPGYIALLPVAGAALVLMCGSGEARLGPAPVSSWRPFVFLGDISYSLYLWHWPLIVLWKYYSGGRIGYLDGPAIAVVSIVLAWLTTTFVENRVRRGTFFTGHRWRSLAVVTGAAVPVLLVVALGVSTPSSFTGHPDQSHPGAGVLAGATTSTGSASASASSESGWVPSIVQAAVDGVQYGQQKHGCQTIQQSAVAQPCVLGDTTHYTHTVAIVGDSTAGMWVSALEPIAVAHHFRIITDLHSLCAFSSTVQQLTGDESPYATCHGWGASVLHYLINQLNPDVVLTTARPAIGTAAHPASGQAAFADIAQGMDSYWATLQRHHIPVIGIRETPEMGHDVPDCLGGRTGSIASCSTKAGDAIVTGTPIVRAVAAARSHVDVINLNRYLCTDVCNPVIGNIIVYRDEHHLTRTYVLSLVPYFQAQLFKAAPELR